MPVKVILPSPPPPVGMHQSGLYSLDLSSGGGLKGRSMVEFAGKSYTGKTTLAIGLAGRLSTDIGLVDLEGDGTGAYAAQLLDNIPGFDGSLWVAPQVEKKKDGDIGIIDEDQIDEGVAWLGKKDSRALVLDSISMVSPVSEQEGSVGDANMGRRAKIMSSAYKKLQRATKPFTDSFFIAVNHTYQKLGTVPGSESSGGLAPKAFSGYRYEVWKKADDETGLWIINGRTIKRRASKAGHVYPEGWNVAMLEGSGVDTNLTSVIDAKLFKLVDEGKSIKLNGKSYGYFSSMIEKRDDHDLFAPFKVACAAYVQEMLA